MYGYERALQAAIETNTTIIQDISKKESHLTLGNIKIDLLNYENEYEDDGSLKNVYDDNLNSILSIVNINNTKIFLGGDLENTERHLEEKYAPLIGHVDVMKFNHHVETTKSNTKEFVDKLNPKKIIKTAIRPVEEMYAEYLKQKNISIINAGQLDRAAISLEFNNGNVTDVSDKYPHYGFYNDDGILKFKNWKNDAPEDGWTQHNDNWYYFFDSGTVAVGWKYIDKNWFYFNQNGELQTGLVNDGNNLYYIEKNTDMLSNAWKEINAKEIYYFKESGQAAKDEWIDRYRFDKDGTLSKNKWIGIFHLNHSGRVSLTDYRNYLFILFTLVIALIFLKIKKKYNGRIIKK